MCKLEDQSGPGQLRAGALQPVFHVGFLNRFSACINHEVLKQEVKFFFIKESSVSVPSPPHPLVLGVCRGGGRGNAG